MPAKSPHLSIAAAVYTGGVRLKTLDEFLSFAVKVEEDAAIHFEQLSAAMDKVGNSDVAALFTQLGMYSRLHWQEAKAKSNSHGAKLDLPASSAWPDQETPERTALWAGDRSLARLDALRAALQGERRGFEFYYAVASTTKDPEIRSVAKEFVREETEHVETLKKWISKEESTVREAAQQASR